MRERSIQFESLQQLNAAFQNATADAQLRKFDELVALFRKHSAEYSVDYLLMMAQGYQESQLDQSVKSRVGAIGVMQVMPATGKELALGDIRQIDPNIEAGVKYMRFMIDQYFKTEPMDDLNKGLLRSPRTAARQGPSDATARRVAPNR